MLCHIISSFLLTAVSIYNANGQVPFTIPFYGETSNGFKSAGRGWNSFGLQANPMVNPNFRFDQSHVLDQCIRLRPTPGHDTYCSLDSGWSVGDHGDENGRIINNEEFPDIKGLADFLHSLGLKLGIYVLPGAFNNDENKTVVNTNITIGSLFNRTLDPTGETCNNYLARSNFDYTKEGVREWHESVVELFNSWGVDMIKLDFVTPGSPEGGCLPYDSSESAKFYAEAIRKLGRPIRLDLSWKLDRSGRYWEHWKSYADSIRTDQDLNNADRPFLVDWEIVQRAINHYRLFIVEQVRDPERHGLPIRLRPDMDNMFVGNWGGLTGLNDQQRYSVAIHWIGAGAKIITGSDMSRIDALGAELLWNEEALEIADFCAQWPMQPRNPTGSETPGGDAASQFQTWIAGPDENRVAVAVQTNLGPDLGQGGFGTRLEGRHNVNITLDDLGIGGNRPGGSETWSVRRVWGVGEDHTGPWNLTGLVETWLGPGESVLYKFSQLD